MQFFIIVTQASDLPLCTIKCCSVDFSVMLRLLVINISSSSPATLRYRIGTVVSVSVYHTAVSYRYSSVCVCLSRCGLSVKMLTPIISVSRLCLRCLRLARLTK